MTGASNAKPHQICRHTCMLELSRHAMEGGAECTGPSLAFVPLRGTKDYAQDDSLVGPEMMSFRLFQAVRYRNTFPLDNLSFRELNIQ